MKGAAIMKDGGNTQRISESFIRARRDHRPLAEFPGDLPGSMDEGYAVQDRSIAAWDDVVAGWKIGMIPPAWRERAGDERLTGPIFSKLVFSDSGRVHEMDVFAGGFAAVEAEFVFRLAADIAPDETLNDAELAERAGSLHVGVEIASSPFQGINDRGPMSVVSDFGNNNGLIVGAEIADWRGISPEDLPAAVDINGERIGRASAAGVPGGPLGALRFLTGLMARRGILLREGDLISTGAATGVHEAAPGSEARADFGPYGAIELALVGRGPQ